MNGLTKTIERIIIPATTLFNANSDGTYYLNKATENICESSDGTISFVCTDCASDPSEIEVVLNPDLKSSDPDANAIYDFTGRRVTSPSRPGIYFRDCKKILVR